MGCIVTRRGTGPPSPCHFVIPEVPVQSGSRVVPLYGGLSDRKMKIIFIFGGPGSRKGRVVTDLVQCFGFHNISAEKLILNQFPMNLSSKESASEPALDNTHRVETMLKKEQSVLTLDWVLGLVSGQLAEAQKKGRYLCLVDVVPNLRAMLQASEFIKDCTKEMREFEEKWPCMFALDLSLPCDFPEDQLLSKIIRRGSPRAKNPELLQAKGGQSDEKDVNKTKKRHLEYQESVKDFLRYFEESDRLVQVDVTCGVADLLWNKVSEIFLNLGFIPKLSVNTVILFAFHKDDIASLDLKKYRMDLVNITSLLPNSIGVMPSTEEMFCALNEYIEKSKNMYESFVVNLEGSMFLNDLCQMDKKRILFLDTTSPYLHHYIYVGASKEDKVGDGLFGAPFKAVSSTENEVCLFPSHVDTDQCKTVAAIYARTKEMVKRRKIKQENRSL